MPCYRFGDFVLSPRRRLLLRDGREQPLIPRYFDLLVLLVERRHEAVHRRDIFDRVWNDVVVSDSALSQAIRTIRRALDDDSREPRFIRTVSRHGYRFIYPDVLEEDESAALPAAPSVAAAMQTGTAVETLNDPFEPLLHRLATIPADGVEEEEQREAAELLHTLGTSEALRRLGTRPHHAFARAVLRDTRWDVASAGEVPFFGQPSPVASSAALIALRCRRAARVAARRWLHASVGGGLSGLSAGAAGGLILVAAPGSAAPLAAVAVLAVIGAACGAIGGAGVAAGLSAAEAVVRSRRTIALSAGAAAGGAAVGAAVQWIARASLSALVGVHVPVGGALEGLIIGGAAGLGFAVSTSVAGEGLAAPRGTRRTRVAFATAASCAVAALALTLAGYPLAGGTVHAIAEASRGSQVALTPLGRLIGEPDFGLLSRSVIGSGEGALFGLGLALGLTHRPRK